MLQHICDRSDCIPIACGDRYPEDPIQRAEIVDHLHVAPVQAEDEPLLPREDFHQPLSGGGKTHRHRWRQTGALRQDTHETDDVGTCWMVREDVVRKQLHDVSSLADHNLGIEGKPPCELSAQLRVEDRLPDHKSPRRANVDGLEVLQLCGERSGSKRSVTADVNAPQENHECHELPLAGATPNHGGQPHTPSTDMLSAQL